MRPYHLHFRMLKVVITHDRLAYGLTGYDDNDLCTHLEALQRAEELIIGGTDPTRALLLEFPGGPLLVKLLNEIDKPPGPVVVTETPLTWP